MPPKGRVTAYAFFVKDKFSRRPPSMSFVAYSRQCAREWREMSAKKKSKYFSMANKDRKQYRRELADYRAKMKGRNLKTLAMRSRREKKCKRIRGPKNAYHFFAQSKFKSLRSKHPNTSLGGIAAIAGKMWRTLSKSSKSAYYEMAKNDRARYRRQLTINGQ